MAAAEGSVPKLKVDCYKHPMEDDTVRYESVFSCPGIPIIGPLEFTVGGDYLSEKDRTYRVTLGIDEE